MKTKKYKLNAIAIGVALATGSMAALAQPPNPAGGLHNAILAERASSLPTFEDSEQAGLAGVESALSLIAGRVHIDHTFCSAKTYTLDVSAFGRDGIATIDSGAGNGGTDLFVTLTPSSELLSNRQTLGTQVDVEAASGSQLKGSAITRYLGDHQCSNNNYIFNDSAEWFMADPQNGTPIPYGEHSIKDYFKRLVSVGENGDSFTESWEFDWGLEKITKHGYPVAKWSELSWYHRPDGTDGYLRVRKDLVKPGNGVCRILYEASSFVDGEFSFNGTVTVFKPTDLNGNGG